MTEGQELFIPIPSSQLRGATSAGPRPLRNSDSVLQPDRPSMQRVCRLSDRLVAGSDIRPFLSARVQADVTRAALRRAWSVDPTIRDFIGLSENSWDFNAPGGVPGFNSMRAEDARRLLARVMEEKESLHAARSPTR